MTASLKIAFWLFLMSPLCFATSSLLRVSIATSHQMPLVEWRGEEKIGGGLLPDLYQAIATEGGYTLDYKIVPRTRVDELYQRKLLDLRCYVAREWVNDPDDYLWSESFYQQEDAFFMLRQKSGEAKSVEEIQNKAVGVVAGYRYNGLAELAKKNNLKVVEVQTPSSMLDLILSHRIDVAIFSKPALTWLLRKKNLNSNTMATPIVLNSQNVFCAIPKNSALAGKQLLKVVNKIIEKKGKSLLKKYN